MEIGNYTVKKNQGIAWTGEKILRRNTSDQVDNRKPCRLDKHAPESAQNLVFVTIRING